jgi:hypothetical protein
MTQALLYCDLGRSALPIPGTTQQYDPGEEGMNESKDITDKCRTVPGEHGGIGQRVNEWVGCGEQEGVEVGMQKPISILRIDNEFAASSRK